MKTLRPFFLIVDIGFIFYWMITAAQVIPGEFLFPDYNDPLLVTWNWSFLPLDLFISATGLASIYLHKRRSPVWRSLALVSLVLTFTSGLQAVAFWAIQGWFDLSWWLPNLFLLVYPLFFIPRMVRVARDASATDENDRPAESYRLRRAE